MKQYDLFCLQLALECKAIAEGDRLIQTPCDDPDEISRVVVAELDGVVRTYVRHDVPRELHEQLRSYEPRALFREPHLVEKTLAALAPTTAARMRSYTIPDGWLLPPTSGVLRVAGDHPDILANYYERSFYDLAVQRPSYVVVVDGEVVSACMSSREDARSGEAWVATDPSRRQHGYGKKAVAGWAQACHEAGKIAFYSHKESNVSSAAMATSLRLPLWGRMVSFA